MMLVDKIKEIINTEIKGWGVDLVDVELRGKPGTYRLSVFVDKDNGISVKECTEISNQLVETPELENILGRQFRLEVSSPGVKRPLKTEKQFRQKTGKELEVTYDEDGNQKKIKGTLLRVEPEGIYIQKDKEEVKISFEQIKKAVQALPW